MKKTILAFVFVMIALILEILPYGAVLKFVTPNSSKIVTYSYFNPEVLGNGSFMPMIIAILTVLLFVLSSILLFKANMHNLITITYTVGLVTAIINLIYSLTGVTVFGLIITLPLICSCVIFNIHKKSHSKN